MTIAYLGLGANLGETLQTMQHAIASLAQRTGIAVRARSGFYRSAPVQADGPPYANCVVCVETSLEPRVLLRTTANIETQFGRTRPYPNAPRTLDIDLLLYGDACIDEADLTVPHPRLTERAFALAPLLELAPDIKIPRRGRAAEFLASVAAQQISRITETGMKAQGKSENALALRTECAGLDALFLCWTNRSYGWSFY